MAHKFFSYLTSNIYHVQVSPADCLDLAVGTDEEGWAIYRTFQVGDIMVSQTGRLYRVMGFSIANTVFASPHGLDNGEDGVSFVEFRPQGLDHPKAEAVLMHKDGLVAFN